MRAEARERVKECAIYTLLLCAGLTFSLATFSACAPETFLRLPPVVGE